MVHHSSPPAHPALAPEWRNSLCSLQEMVPCCQGTSLPAAATPVLWHNVTQNALCLSAHSWKVTVNDECSCVGAEEVFFSLLFFLFFLSFHGLHHLAASWLHSFDSCGYKSFPIVVSLLPPQPLCGQSRIFMTDWPGEAG